MADGNFDNVSATGNIAADGYISAAGNVTAESLLFASPTTANLSVGNIALYSNLNMTGAISAGGNVLAASFIGNIATANQPNITSVGTLTSLSVSGNTTSGNVLTSGIVSSTGNATHSNVTTGIVSANAVLANTITFNSPTTSNIDVGNLALYNNLNMTGSISSAGNITGARLIGNLFTANQPNITSVGTLTSLSVSGNATAGNVLTPGIVSSAGNATHGNVAAGIVSANAVLTNTITFNSPTTANISVGNLALYSNLNMTGSVSAAGNIRGNYFLGNGYYLTGISGVASNYGNSNVAAYLPTYTGNLTANIISTTGNITGSYILGNGSQLTGIDSSYGNANTAGFLANFGSNTINTTGSIDAGNVTLNNLYSPNYFANAIAFANATGYITTSSLFKYNSGTEVLTVGTVSTTGNITANYFIGNGSQLTGISSGSNTGNVTFDDINIIGTGNLHLQPDPTNSASFLDVFLTSGPDLHLVASNGANLILGEDTGANVLASWNGNVSVQSWNQSTGNLGGIWTFAGDGNLTLPRGGVVYETNIPDGGLNGNTIALTPSGGTNADQQLLIYPTTNDANHLHLTSGNLYSTELFLGSDDLYIKLANTGNVVINSNDGAGNTAQWTLDTTGNLTIPGGMIINGNINTLGSQTALLQAADDLPLSFISSGANGSVTSFWAEDFANVMTSNIAAIYTPLQNTQTVRIVTGNNGGNIAIYDFDNEGMFTAANVCATGNVYAGNVAASGNISGNIISASGNITAANFVGNGSTLSNVATTTTGSWTLAAGTNTVSFGVPINGTYSIWVRGNIPNGIITYTAQAVVTNPNVPVLGSSYGWYYEDGNALVLTAIPTQFVGTLNNISNANITTTTANVFTFGITNNSGNSQVVDYGYTRL